AVPLARARALGRARARLPRLGVLILLALVALVFAIPFYWVLLSSVKTVGELRAIPPTWWPETFTLNNFPRAWSGKFGRYMINSFVYAGLSTVVITFTSSLIGYVLIKDRSRLGELFFWFVLSAAMVPFVTYLFPLFLMLLRIQDLLGLPVINTYLGMVLPWVVNPFGIFLMRQAMFGVPDELLDAARIDGASDFTTFTRVVFPLVQQSAAALMILTFIFRYDDLLWPLVVAQQPSMYPVTVGLAEFVGDYFVELDLFNAAALMAMLPIALIYVFLQRYIVEGIATQGMKG
ncbi:MAG TPA: carbohydrate ABC transporter permease, partial [Chloroflexota bacterium]